MKSIVRDVAQIALPQFQGDRLYMHAIDVNAPALPQGYGRWSDTLNTMLAKLPMSEGIVYLTIDERTLQPGKSHRRGGAHIDGVWKPAIKAHEQPGSHIIHASGDWEEKGQWSMAEGGLMLLASETGCRGWNGDVYGKPGAGGDMEAHREQLDAMPSLVMQPGIAYLCNGWGVHESTPATHAVNRSLVRLTLPEGVTVK